jgi:DNA-binding MarR family transcriptional regulator
MDKENIIESFERTHKVMHELTGKLTVEYYEKYSHHQIIAILWLKRNGKNRLKDIAAQTKMSASSLCVMFNELEKDSLILREIDRNDRRNTYYSLSEYGKTTADEIMKQFREAISKMLEPLSEDELEKVADSFNAISEILEKYI